MKSRFPFKKKQQGFILNPYVFGTAAPPPPPPSTGDAAFPYVKLLVHSASEADFPSTIVDSSPYRRAGVVSGNTTLTSAKTLLHANSIYLDGAGDFVQWPGTDYYGCSDKNFAVEIAYWPHDATTNQCLLSVARPGAVSGSEVAWALIYEKASAAGKVSLTLFNGTAAYVVQSTVALPTDKFTRIAVSRRGSLFRILFDGVVVGTATIAQAVNNPTGLVMRFGAYINADPYYAKGWFDEIRYTVGVGRYYGNYTVDAAPFYDENTSFQPRRELISALLHFDGVEGAVTTVDSGPKALSVSFQNGAKLTATNAVFGPTCLELTSVNGRYAVIGHSTALNFADQDFTVSIRFRMKGHSRYNNGVYKSTLYGRDTQSGGREFSISLAGTGTSTTSIEVNLFQNNSTVTTINVPYTFALHTNYHIEVCRKLDKVYVFLDGVLLSTTTYTPALNITSQNSYIGALVYNIDYLYYFDGFIDEVLILKGKGNRWASYTNPTVPYNNFASYDDEHFLKTTLLLQMEGADAETIVPDYSLPAKVVTAYGNAKLSTALAKFGTSSLLLDGTGDYLRAGTADSSHIANADFTLEVIAYMTVAGTRAKTLLATRAVISLTQGYDLVVGANDSISFAGYANDTFPIDITSGAGVVPVNQWVHIEVSRVGTTTYLFVDGVLVGQDTSSGTINKGADLYIGRRAAINTTQDWPGYIAAVRVTINKGRHTAAFVPPSTRFPIS